MPEKIQERSNKTINTTSSIIPTQYENMLSELVEETLKYKALPADNEKIKSILEDRKQIIEAVQQKEFKREEEKEKTYQQLFQGLSEDRKVDFPRYLEQTSNQISKYVTGEESFDGLSGEEKFILGKLQMEYDKFRKEYPEKPFNFEIKRGIDKKILSNLQYRLAFDSLYENSAREDKQRAEDILKSIKGMESPKKSGSDIPLKDEPLSGKIEQGEKNKFREFKVKNGETDTGVFWYEYNNEAAKELKESGKMKWGKERIYFDIPIEKMETLRDLAFQVAGEQEIPIGFKHLDTQKSFSRTRTDDTTRFVANFASAQDAKRFYEALVKHKQYAKMKSDRNLDYYGYNIDGVAHYASGYREKREPLIRMIETARQNQDGSYSYKGPSGEKRDLSESDYEMFKKQYDSMPNAKEVWNKA